jgi:tetratricopeptide (TPR) repeat protein
MNARSTLSAIGVVCSLIGVATAQPAGKDVPDPKATARLNATELRDLGNKLFDEKNYNGALAVFKEAHARFPSVKILLNIGVTLNKLERFADAANAFQRYVDAPDADASVKPEIVKAIAEIDAKVAVVELSISPSDADVQINDGDWFSAKTYA